MPLALLSVVLISLTPARVEPQKVVFDRLGYRLTSIGSKVVTTARVVDASGRPVPNARITFRVADPSVAAVSSQGEVVSRKTGRTYVWAISGKDSASAIVLVEQWAAKYAFTPALLRFDALSAKSPLKVEVSDSAGHPIAGGPVRLTSCRSLNDRIAMISAAGDVIANGNGATYIRCADKGLADSIRVEVQQRPTKATVSSKSLPKFVGDTFTVKLKAIDRQSKDILDARPTWASLDPTIVTVDPTTGKGLSRATGFTRVIAQLGDVADTVNVQVSPPRNGGFLDAQCRAGRGCRRRP